MSSTTVGNGSKKSLDKVAAWLNANTAASIVIEGYADPTGSHDDNLTLSKARADAGREYLIAAGVDGSRIEVLAFGDTKLKYGARDGRNRRIAIILKP